MPSDTLKNYSYLESVGAAVFLLVQIVLLIDFCYDAADWFKENGLKKNHAGETSIKPCWGFLMILVIVTCFCAVVAMIVLGFRWFTTPVASAVSTINGKCGFNSFVLVFAVILFVVGTGMQFAVLARTGNGSVVTAFFIGAYCMWNTFSGLLASNVCQSQVSNNAFVEPISILLTIMSAAYAAFQFPKVCAPRPAFDVFINPCFTCSHQVTEGMTKSTKAGAAATAFQRDEEAHTEAPASDDLPVPYSYPKFHVAFCFASCFVSMQLSNWLELCVAKQIFLRVSLLLTHALSTRFQ